MWASCFAGHWWAVKDNQWFECFVFVCVCSQTGFLRTVTQWETVHINTEWQERGSSNWSQTARRRSEDPFYNLSSSISFPAGRDVMCGSWGVKDRDERWGWDGGGFVLHLHLFQTKNNTSSLVGLKHYFPFSTLNSHSHHYFFTFITLSNPSFSQLKTQELSQTFVASQSK